LETLVDAGVARRLELDGHVYAYVACLPAHHHHIACTRCGRVEEIDEAFVTPLAERLADELGFEIDDARLDFYGRCLPRRRRGDRLTVVRRLVVLVGLAVGVLALTACNGETPSPSDGRLRVVAT